MGLGLRGGSRAQYFDGGNAGIRNARPAVGGDGFATLPKPDALARQSDHIRQRFVPTGVFDDLCVRR